MEPQSLAKAVQATEIKENSQIFVSISVARNQIDRTIYLITGLIVFIKMQNNSQFTGHLDLSRPMAELPVGYRHPWQ